MGAVEIFGSPIDKKKYRKMATGTLSGTASAGANFDTSEIGVKFEPHLIIVVSEIGGDPCRSGYRFNPSKFGNYTKKSGMWEVFNNSNQWLYIKPNYNMHADGYGLYFSIQNVAPSTPMPYKVRWVAWGW